MKVVQINANADFGSTGLVVQGIHDCLEKNGIDSLIVYQRCNIRPNKGYKVGNIIDWKLHAIMTRLFGHFGFYSRVATRRLLRYFDKEKPDVVHLHNVHSNYVNIKLLLEYLSKNNVATVLTLHDCWFFTGKCFHYIDVDCSKFIIGCNDCPKKCMPPYYWMDSSKEDWLEKKTLFSRMKNLYIVGCSKWVCNEASKSFLKWHKIQCIYNGVDISVFRPIQSNLRKDLNIADDSFVILGMANKWLLDRNREAIEEIFKIKDTTIIILGCTQQQLTLQKTMPSNVILKGFTSDRNELAEYYSAADVFVNLTHADTLPTVIMESICCGTPVITYDVGGCPELIIDKSGIVVKEDDLDGLLHAVHAIRRKPLPNCSSVGMTYFDRRSCFHEYVNLYNQIKKR